MSISLQVKHLKFTFKLTKEDGSVDFHGIKLDRFAMQELAGNVCYVTFRPPEQASYMLVIYAKDSTDKVLLLDHLLYQNIYKLILLLNYITFIMHKCESAFNQIHDVMTLNG